MASVVQIAPPNAIRRIQRVQTMTIAWMSVEALLVSLFAAWRARSPALLAFGGDSAIELFSAAVVLWSFPARRRLKPIVTWLSEFELPMLGPVGAKRQRLRGKVARIFKFKNFGFISRAGGEKLFFHRGEFVRRIEWSDVDEGVEVEFEIGSNKQGECAIRVRVVDTVLENAATGKI